MFPNVLNNYCNLFCETKEIKSYLQIFVKIIYVKIDICNIFEQILKLCCKLFALLEMPILSKSQREKVRRQQMKSLKKKYGLAVSTFNICVKIIFVMY